MDLLMWLFHRHDARRFGSVYHASSVHHIGSVYYIADVVIWMILGIPMGLSIWNSRERTSQRGVSRNRAIVQNVLFWSLMAFLALLLWKMW